MQIFILFLIISLLSLSSFWLGRRRSLRLVSGETHRLHSLPVYYGLYVALWVGIPALLLLLAWFFAEDKVITSLVLAEISPGILAGTSGPDPARVSLVLNDIRNIVSGASAFSPVPEIQSAALRYAFLKQTSFSLVILVSLATAVISGFFALRWVTPLFRARNRVENAVKAFMIGCSIIAILTTVGIVLSLLVESWRFFGHVAPVDFLFGLEWSPQTAMRADQAGSSGSFGAVPLFAGTLLISLIAMLVAVPVGLMAAIYMAEYAPARVRGVVKPVLEILAGIPTVVYGFFAALTVAPLFRGIGHDIGLTISSESALAAGIVMGIMIVPFVSSLSDDVITAVPRAMREGSYGLGATRSETIRRVVLPAALPGIVGGILLAVSRAIGETMIVVMAAGLSANLTANPFEAVTTVTVQIVTLLVGDQEFDSPKTLAAFALGLVLFVMTLALNVVALHVVRKYREQYE
ncbi:phosphate ABC transporter permease subunit PstC [Haematospirillum jordaniae]|uniref:Phosphate transport system permease protein n=1 Tax=Haematospirillum jordaniae TaxID=1549855 RepID=A0A145VTE1_9PROT|nr:phosphate ABC transporter permease subunit PstC [Haematospirillum jordaniae]AMW35980.1 phosphate ABC transporter permease [Haematospirillum jordaniae]NKD45935.1 phosphate ABC transporter permease subunit PstC [Haematospirillum jordaniae]NKD58013.1 phosphate ABC transporter permease subunit PstC [Haematospirillum jordaniae]NKD60055.1 phosphate ABC transporter permease subunit PstC [Haematospirillum jordaniae]NKD68010.1 phosphate ABC transporter permease subunit PstC [Haematospirillum jordani